MRASREKKIVVVYHGDCPDGFSGAWAAWKKFGSRARYVGASDRVNPPLGLQGKEVYFIDWVYPLAAMQKVRRSATRVIAIDHHITAETASKAMDDYIFDLKHSAAVLAWNYFYPKKPVPKFLEYIEDIDLWLGRFKETQPLRASFELIPQDFKTWDRISRSFKNSNTRKEFLEQGNLILKYERNMLKNLLPNAALINFEGHKVLAINSPVLHSELGAALVRQKPPFGVVWREVGGKIRVSLRSRSDRGTEAKFDVSKIAKKYGGGGHPVAAGFTLDTNKPLPWKRIR